MNGKVNAWLIWNPTAFVGKLRLSTDFELWTLNIQGLFTTEFELRIFDD
jgi:hypothetical protein